MPAPTIEVKTEQESDHGWSYEIAVDRPGGARTEHTVTLAWVDSEHWAGGRFPPSRVVEALVGLLVEREAQRPLPDRFDAATARRWHPDLDALLPTRIAK
jgi:hypothetical protein